MKNHFVDYLNSMNNAGSNTIAALAESQVLSSYYEKIRIKRKLGEYIAERIKSDKPTAYLITGHAGDGKTSILVQILTELGLLQEKQPLQEECCYSWHDTSVYAVKDMSELSKEKQLAYFKKAMLAPQSGNSSVLISNTGPLLKCFEKLISADCQAEGKSFSEKEKNDLQNIILEQLDINRQDIITVGNYQVMMINIARIDNVDFSSEFLHKILAEELWNTCEECPKKEFCPVIHNIELLRKYEKRVSEFIVLYYRFLYENDKRMTIRQMLSQISYAVTGNLTCEEIKKNKKQAKFVHLFSNQFFGYQGMKQNESAMQIQGIRHANEMKLDTIALSYDYKMFVTGDFSDMLDEISAIAEGQYHIFSRQHLNSDEDVHTYDKDFLYRKAVRRMFILFGYSEDKMLYDELFGKGFNDYIKLITENKVRTIRERKLLQKTIMEALYLESTGVAAKNVSEIPLTLRRNDHMYQKVLVISGKIKKDDLKIEIFPIKNHYDDNENKNELILKICGKKDFRITLPMVLYFEKLAEGAISTSENPALTHGISKLKTLLQECGSSDKDDSVVEIMLNKTDSAKYCEIQCVDDTLYF